MKLFILLLAFFFFVGFGAALDLGGVLNGVSLPLNVLRKELDSVLIKIKDSIDKGNDIPEEILERAKKLRDELRARGLKIDEKARDLLGNIREDAKNLLFPHSDHD